MSVFSCYADVTGSPCLPSRRHRARSAPYLLSWIASLAAAAQAQNESHACTEMEMNEMGLTRRTRARSDSTFETSSGSCASMSRQGACCTNESVHQMACDTLSVTLAADVYISRGETCNRHHLADSHISKPRQDNEFQHVTIQNGIVDQSPNSDDDLDSTSDDTGHLILQRCRKHLRS